MTGGAVLVMFKNGETQRINQPEIPIFLPGKTQSQTNQEILTGGNG